MTSVGVVGAVAMSALALEAVGTASAAAPATVTLAVDGVGLEVTTSANTVGELLADESVALDETDLISPRTSAPITDRMTVDVDHISLVSVKDNGTTEKHLVSADTVTEVHEELKLPAPEFAALSAESQKPVTFRRTLMFGSAGKRLASTGVVRDGAVAVVQDVRIGYPQTKKRVDHQVRKQHSNLLRAGATRVFRGGHDGVRRLTYRRTFVEGKLAKQRVVERHWVRKPQRRVIRIGTGPNWPALARCESGGNPNAVNPAGYYGLYQFSLSTWQSLGGRGNPTDHGYWGQTRIAWKLYRQSGSSPWPVCGVHL